MYYGAESISPLESLKFVTLDILASVAHILLRAPAVCVSVLKLKHKATVPVGAMKFGTICFSVSGRRTSSKFSEHTRSPRSRMRRRGENCIWPVAELGGNTVDHLLLATHVC